MVDLGVSSEVDQVLVRRLETDLPQSVLIVAPKLPEPVLNLSSQAENMKLTHLAFESFEKSTQQLGRYEFAAVLESTFEHLSDHTARQLVARLRDLHAKLLWVAVSDCSGSVYSSKDAMAHGMRLVDATKFGSSDTKWFEFSLKFYKPVPKWLNAKDWANPERWDKDRW